MNHSLFAGLNAEASREFAVRKERNRKLRNAFVMVSMGIISLLLGAGLTILLSLIPALGWVSIAVFAVAVFGLQRMIFKDFDRKTSWFWWLLFTVVMGYFTAPMIRFAVWGTYSDKALLVIILGLCGVLSWLFVTISYAGLTRLDFIRLQFIPGVRVRLGAMMVLDSWILHIPSHGGISLGSSYPLLENLSWFSSIVVCLAACFSLAIIKKTYGVAGLVWLVLFTFITGYFIPPLTNIDISYDTDLFLYLGLVAMVTIAFSIYYLFRFDYDFYSVHYSKANIISIWALATLYNLTFINMIGGYYGIP